MEKFSESSQITQKSKEKKYSKLKSSSLFHFFNSSSQSESPKKLVATKAQPGLREDFKKTFLPLFIEVFELRQMIETYKTHKTSPELSYFGKVSKTPQEILKQLKQLQNDIEESQRWCSGIILQISKGLSEAKEALELLESRQEKSFSSQSPPKTGFFKKLLKNLGFYR